jgi:PIN domain nuclease of toxin-antitoxin system
VIHLDTHVAAWLYAGRTDLFPAGVRSRLEREDLVVSPMVVLELQYLYEVGKTTEPGDVVMSALRRVLPVQVSDLPFEAVVSSALGATWTRDPFDRIIASQADLAEAPLVTKDRNIHRHYSRALWK